MAAVPKTMSGIVIDTPGDVDVLKWKTDIPVPDLKDGEVLVKNEYIGVNYIDTYFRTGLYKATYPLITGHEAAGTVARSNSPSFKEGDRVAYLAPGAYAELTAVPAARMVALPSGVTTQQAAGAMLQGLTALTLVHEAAGIPRSSGGGDGGVWALVHAAAGGVGSLLVQVLSAAGARVIASAGGKDKCAIAKGYGAGWTLDSHSDDLPARVKEITGGHGVDAIFDGVGKATFDKDLEMIARKGSLVMFGNASGAVPPFDILKLGPKNMKLLRPVVFNYLVEREELEGYSKELFELLQGGKMDVKVHEVYPLKDVGRAHSDLTGRKTTGKLILKV